jgi:hypothetical protein
MRGSAISTARAPATSGHSAADRLAQRRRGLRAVAGTPSAAVPVMRGHEETKPPFQDTQPTRSTHCLDSTWRWMGVGGWAVLLFLWTGSPAFKRPVCAEGTLRSPLWSQRQRAGGSLSDEPARRPARSGARGTRRPLPVLSARRSLAPLGRTNTA